MDDGPGLLLFHHYNFTHDPVDFDRACKLEKARELTFDNNKGTVACGLNELASLVQKLKRLDVYDNTMIIFMSDHGQNCKIQRESYELKNGHSYEPGGGPSSRWCPARWNPFLLVKGFGQRGILKLSDQKTSLLDIAPTICTAAFSKEYCSQKNFEGYDVLDSIPEDRIRPVMLNAEFDPGVTYEDYEKVLISGDVWTGVQTEFMKRAQHATIALPESFNHLTYMAAWPKLISVFGFMEEPARREALENHLLEYGVIEGRTAHLTPTVVEPINEGLPQDFQHLLYMVVHNDLINEFYSLPEPARQDALEKHYLTFGKNENRSYRP